MFDDLQAFHVHIDSPHSQQDEWYHIMPMGKTIGFDGRGPYILKDPAKVIATSLRPKVDLPVDRDHETLFMPRGTQVKAAGWIKDMAARDDGIWAQIEWTKSAANQLKAKEYRYLSPVFKHNPATGEILSIQHVSLTNNPNFELTAAASADSNHQKEITPMEEFLSNLAAILGLPETATAEEILTEVTNRLQMREEEKTAEASTANNNLAAGVSTPDPAQFVPMSVFNEVKIQLAQIQKDQSARTAQEAVTAAMQARKVTPAMREWAYAYASSDLQGFQSYVASAPVIVSAASEISGQVSEKTEEELTEDVRDLVELLGLDSDTVEKILNEDLETTA